MPCVEAPAAALLFEALFSTGARIGEAFALTESKVKSDVIHIDEQLTRSLRLTQRKNGGECFAVVLPSGLSSVREWPIPRQRTNSTPALVQDLETRLSGSVSKRSV